MAKATVLTPEALQAPQITPKAATPPRAPEKPAIRLEAQPEAAPEPKSLQVPLQVRIPKDEARAIKIAAAEREQTISEFMLACFHAYMESGKHVAR